MSDACRFGHPVPRHAVFCPECWTLLSERTEPGPAPAPEKPRRTRLAVLLGLLVLVAAVAWVIQMRRDAPERVSYSGPVRAAQLVQPAVFRLEVADSTGRTVGQGSGFLVDSAGLAVTAFHVLQGRQEAKVWFEDRRLFHVLAVEAWDPVADVAVFRVGRASPEGEMHPRLRQYPALRLKSAVNVGEPIVALGSPEGFENTMSDGLVSAIRDARDKSERIQFTAPISSGSSGGPLFDGKGRVVGIVVSRWTEGQNLNFAAPVSAVNTLLRTRHRTSMSEFAAQTREKEEPSSNPLADELFLSGNRQLERGEFAEALKRYELALQAQEDRADAHFNAAVCLVKLGRLAEATPHFRRFLELPHDTGEFHDHAVSWLQRHADVE